MRAAALLLLAGCAQIFGLAAPHPAADDAAVTDGLTADTPDGHIDLADAAPGHCVTIADCPTSVCLPSTVCAADTDVAWLDPIGTASSACSSAMPCNSLSSAISTSRPYVRVHGVISQLATISRDVSIFAEPGGAFTGTNLNVNNGNVGLYELELANTCLQLSSGTLTAEHIYVHDCSNVGIIAQGTLLLDGSTVSKNRSGGIVILGPTFSITNNFITRNGVNGGGGSTNDGGLVIQSANATNSHIDFNTVVGNAIKTGTSVAGGIYCNINGFTATGNVVVHNTAGGSTGIAYANTNGACAFASSVIQASDSLGFVDTVTGDYHITATSPLRDAATVPTGQTTDVDGESRPYGSAYDIGADEYHP
jgi:hypothetical protein